MARNIVYIGSSAFGLECLLNSPHFAVDEVLCLAKRLTPPLETLARTNRIVLTTFSGIADFRALVERNGASMPFFIYQLDMLVPADLTERYAFFNVHRGNLQTNRGPNPDVWPILNGSPHTSLSLHKINENVDSGALIDAFEVPIAVDDDTLTVRAKLEKGLPDLIISLHHYLEGSRAATPLVGGIYRPWIKEADFTIDLSVDSLDAIGRKIRSQRQYNGAILLLDGKKYYVVDILEATPCRPGQDACFFADAGIIRTCSNTHTLVLQWNEHPKHPPPPIRPPSKRV